jgi:hypothetical protein
MVDILLCCERVVALLPPSFWLLPLATAKELVSQEFFDFFAAIFDASVSMGCLVHLPAMMPQTVLLIVP